MYKNSQHTFICNLFLSRQPGVGVVVDSHFIRKGVCRVVVDGSFILMHLVRILVLHTVGRGSWPLKRTGEKFIACFKNRFSGRFVENSQYDNQCGYALVSKALNFIQQTEWQTYFMVRRIAINECLGVYLKLCKKFSKLEKVNKSSFINNCLLNTLNFGINLNENNIFITIQKLLGTAGFYLDILAP